MKNKILHAFTNNIGLKLVALIFAIVAWFVVVNVDNPSKSGNFTVPVTVMNENILTDAGKYVSIKSGGQAVTFRATAKRSIFDRLSSADFIAVADLKNLEDDGRVPIEIRAVSYSKQVTISTRTHYLEVEITDVKATKFVIEPQISGEPAKGSAVGDVSVSPNVVAVEGPADVVDSIDSVVAICDVDGMSDDLVESAVPVYLDANGNQIDTTKLTTSVSSVNVSVDMLSVVDVKLNVETSGELSEGLKLDSVKTDPESIRVMGEAKVLNELTAVTIPGSAVKLDAVSETMTTTVNITSYLPDGVVLADGQDAQVKVIITLMDMDERTFEVPVSNFTTRNLGDGLSASFTEDTVEVTVRGYKNLLDQLKEDDITGSVDLDGLDVGEHRLKLQPEVDDELTAGSVTVVVSIEADEEEEENHNNDEGE